MFEEASIPRLSNALPSLMRSNKANTLILVLLKRGKGVSTLQQRMTPINGGSQIKQIEGMEEKAHTKSSALDAALHHLTYLRFDRFNFLTPINNPFSESEIREELNKYTHRDINLFSVFCNVLEFLIRLPKGERPR